MKKTILILLFAIATLSFNLNAAEDGSFSNSNLKKIGWGTAGAISLAAFVPALTSDFNAQPGTAQAEVPLCVLPLMVLLLSGLCFE